MRNFRATSVEESRWILKLPPLKFGKATIHKNITNMLSGQFCKNCGLPIAEKAIVRFLKNSGMVHVDCL